MAEEPGANPKEPKPPAPDRIDGYVPQPYTRQERGDHDQQLIREAKNWAAGELEAGRMDASVADGFINQLTGIGDPAFDKSLGGMLKGRGLEVVVRFIGGTECEDRWRGTDLGSTLIETNPDEMTREGFTIQIQPDEADEQKRADRWDHRSAGLGERILEQLRRADARNDSATAGVLRAILDAAPEFGGAPEKTIPSSLPPLDLPEDDGTETAEALMKKWDELKASEIFRDGMCMRRAFGGSGILLGINDGRRLSQPLDESKIPTISHITAFRGGWDGELIGWSYYNDMAGPKFGMPATFMLRNLGVPISQPPPPGEPGDPESWKGVYTTGDYATSSLMSWVHESRLLLFPGRAVSHRVRVQMRGWGESIFVPVDEVLSQFGQTFNSVATLMQDWAQGVLKIDGLAARAAAPEGDGMDPTVPQQGGLLYKRLFAIMMGRSVARTMLLDKNEEFTREVAPLTGVSDVLNQMWLRVAAAAHIPQSKLTGQVKGGLGDAGNTDLRYWMQDVAAEQKREYQPPARRLLRLLMLAADGPTRKKEVAKWVLTFNPLYKPTAKEIAEERKIYAEIDDLNVGNQIYLPQEAAASRYGGSKFGTEIVIDLELRKKMAAEEKKRKAMQPPPNPRDPNAPPAPERKPGDPAPTTPAPGGDKGGGPAKP